MTKRKSMVAFNIKVLLLSSKELSPYRRVSVICKSFLSKMCLLMFLIVETFFWAQNFSSIKRILILQKKAVRVINFQPRNLHTSPLFEQNFILKFQDKICIENILFASKSLNNLSPSIFNTWFSFSSDQRNYKTKFYTGEPHETFL